ncbi:MAG: hypothetical protein Q9165_007379 [Trypethelium subeluteriae]
MYPKVGGFRHLHYYDDKYDPECGARRGNGRFSGRLVALLLLIWIILATVFGGAVVFWSCEAVQQAWMRKSGKRKWLQNLQLIWSTIFSHGSAYLFFLSITPSQSSLIWAIAPLCGAIIQPLIGSVSDTSRSRFGRRRPFILGGAVGVIISLSALAWVGAIMHGLASLLGRSESESLRIAIQAGTIICVTMLNLSMQPLQLGLRALIVDACPADQQSSASAWAGRFTGIANILGYILGSLPLGAITHDNEARRFRVLTLSSVAALVGTVATTCYFIREDDGRDMVYEPQDGMLILRFARNMRNGWSSMTVRARRVCCVQFFAWMGWFGFLFYSTSYVGRLYIDESRRNGVEHFYFLQDAGIRLGTFASLLSAVAAFATTVIVPQIARAKEGVSLDEKEMFKGLKRRVKDGKWWQTHVIWAMSLCLYAVCTFCTIFIVSTNAAILVIALTGVSWGITQWAPFALLGEEIAMRQAEGNSTAEEGGRQWTTSQSGAIMGVHNAAISVPQILAAVGSSFIFWLFEDHRSGGNDGIAWVLRCSGVAALIAAYFAWRLN